MIVNIINGDKFEREAKQTAIKARLVKRIENLSKYRLAMTDSERLDNWFKVGNEINKLYRMLNSL
jgi:hypothetical protein